MRTIRWPIIATVLVIVCAPGVAAAQSTPAKPADPAAGARLFQSRGCVDCHAADVADFQRQARPLHALAAAMWNHFPHMADRIRVAKLPTPYVTSGEMRDLAAFLGTGTEAPAMPGDPRRGEQVVRTKGCLGCHSISAPRGQRAGRLDDLKGLESPWTVVAQMWNHAFLMELETQAQLVPWPRLTPDEMADLVAFLEALMRAR